MGRSVVMCAMGAAAVLVLGGVALSACGSSGSSDSAAMSQLTAAPPTDVQSPEDAATASAPAVDPGKADAQKYVAEHGDEAHKVQVDIQTVQAGFAVIIQEGGGADLNEVASFSNLVDEAHSDIDGIRHGFVTDGGRFMNQADEITDAANQLKNSMAAINTFLASPTAPNLASFQRQYGKGVAEWNDGVTAIWTAAGQTPPTLAAATP